MLVLTLQQTILTEMYAGVMLINYEMSAFYTILPLQQSYKYPHERVERY